MASCNKFIEINDHYREFNLPRKAGNCGRMDPRSHFNKPQSSFQPSMSYSQCFRPHVEGTWVPIRKYIREYTKLPTGPVYPLLQFFSSMILSISPQVCFSYLVRAICSPMAWGCRVVLHAEYCLLRGVEGLTPLIAKFGLLGGNVAAQGLGSSDGSTTNSQRLACMHGASALQRRNPSPLKCKNYRNSA